MNNNDKMFQQFAVIKRRLETFPFANHEVICLRDCLVAIIRSIAGEELTRYDVDRLGAGPSVTPGRSGAEQVLIGGRMMQGGVETHPGVTVYQPVMQDGPPQAGPAPQQGAALIDVASALAPKAVPGSLMSQVQQDGGEVDEFKATNPQSPQGLPKPEDTKVEIIKSPEDSNQPSQIASGNHSSNPEVKTG